MARKLILPLALAALWLVVLSVPTLRVQFATQMVGYELYAHGALCVLGIHRHPADWPPRPLDKFARQHPDDVEMQAMAAERVGEPWDPRKVVERYEALMQRFSQEPWLCANSLRIRSMWMWDDRVEALEIEPQPYYTSRRSPSPVTEVQQAISTARRGVELEPDNAFFDLKLSYLLFCSRRDDEAIATLRSAATKPRYDVHLREETAARLRVARLEFGRPMLSEEKCALWQRLSWYLPDMAEHKQVARLAIWHAKKATELGQHERALDIYGDLIRIWTRMRDDAHSSAQCLFAIALQTYTWAWEGGDPSITLKEAVSNVRNQQVLLAAKKAAAYAEQHGHADLAKETLREGQQSSLMRQRTPGKPGYLYPVIPSWLPGETWERLFRLWWAGTALIVMILAHLLLWLVLTALVCRRQLPVQPVKALDVTAAILFAAWLPVLLLLVGASMAGEVSLHLFHPRHPMLPLVVTCVALAPPMLTILYCARVTTWRHRKATRGIAPSLSSSESSDCAVTSHPPSLMCDHGILASGIAYVLDFALILATLASWLLAILTNLTLKEPRGIEYRLNIALLLTAACLVWWRVRALLSYPPSVQNIAAYGLCWFRRMVAIWIVIASVGYFGTLVAAWPDRRMTEARMERVINEGEMALVREMAGSQQ